MVFEKPHWTETKNDGKASFVRFKENLIESADFVVDMAVAVVLRARVIGEGGKRPEVLVFCLEGKSTSKTDRFEFDTNALVKVVGESQNVQDVYIYGSNLSEVDDFCLDLHHRPNNKRDGKERRRRRREQPRTRREKTKVFCVFRFWLRDKKKQKQTREKKQQEQTSKQANTTHLLFFRSQQRRKDECPSSH